MKEEIAEGKKALMMKYHNADEKIKDEGETKLG